MSGYDAETNAHYQSLLRGVLGIDSAEDFARGLSPEMLTTDYDIWFGYFVRHVWEAEPDDSERAYTLQALRHVVRRCAEMGVQTATEEFFGELPPSLWDDWGRVGEAAGKPVDEVIARHLDVVNHPDFPGLCVFLRGTVEHGLAVAYHDRYRERQDPGDLSEALDQLEATLEASPEDWPFNAGAFGEASVCLLDRYESEQTLRDLDLAIAAAEKAITAALPNVLEMCEFYGAYGSALVGAYNARAESDMLDAAIEAYTQAGALAKPGSERRAKYLDNLALAQQQAAHG